MTITQTTTRVLLATIAGALAFLVAGVGGAAAAPAAAQQATSRCWLQVINDWENNNQVDKIYAVPCYTQAIQHLSAYPDIAGYSSAIDDIKRAMLAVIHQEGRGGPGSGTPSNITPGPGNNNSTGNGTGGGTTHRSLWTRLTDRLSPGNAQSVPLPLIVLAGLALLLLLAAAATWFARRLQTRRVTPAPARAPRP
jgi:uncharacterized membrane protein YidH (DUF202 family)